STNVLGQGVVGLIAFANLQLAVGDRQIWHGGASIVPDKAHAPDPGHLDHNRYEIATGRPGNYVDDVHSGRAAPWINVDLEVRPRMTVESVSRTRFTRNPIGRLHDA